MINNLTGGLLGTVCIAAISVLQYSSLNQLTSNTKDSFFQNNYSNVEQTVEQLKILKNTPSFGFGNSIANWGFIQFLQYFGDEEARNHSGYGYSPEFFKAVLSHDPCYTNFYLFLSGSTTLYAGEPQKAVNIMQSSLNKINSKRAEDNFFAWRYKAVDELLFLGDSKAAQESFQMASKWALQSADERAPLMAQLSEQTAQFLETNPNSHLARINAWSSILTTALDSDTRDRAVEKIQSLGGDVIFSENGGISIQYGEIETSAEAKSTPET